MFYINQYFPETLDPGLRQGDVKTRPMAAQILKLVPFVPGTSPRQFDLIQNLGARLDRISGGTVAKGPVSCILSFPVGIAY